MEHVVVLCTCPPGEARDIARALLDEHLIACANLAAVTSLYTWKDEVEETEETLLVMKTTREHWPGLRDRILELHSYDVPEVLLLPVGDGSAGYLAWLEGAVA
ncbi:MAG: divalent-cation tolerance protein CutA [Thermoplasmatota archaeon]